MTGNARHNYGDEMAVFKLDYLGGHPGMDGVIINATVTIYENGLLLSSILAEKRIFLPWGQINSVLRSSDASDRITIAAEEGEIALQAVNQGDAGRLERLISSQKNKHLYHDSLKKLEVDFEELCVAMDAKDTGSESFLDTLTGDIVIIPEDLDEDNIYDDEYIEELPEWEGEIVENIRAIFEDEDDRYRSIPRSEASDAYGIMVKFAESLEDPKIKAVLLKSLEGRGAFGRFKAAVGKYPDIKEEWTVFRVEKEKEYVREWLYSIGIDPVEKK